MPHLVSTTGADTKTLYLEFGVYEGYSIGWLAEHLTHGENRFYGFDSFEGLPEDWGAKPAGTFSTAGTLPETGDPRVSFVKGWFQDTLPTFEMAENAFDNVIVHLDADLYSSSLFVLSQLWHKLDGFYAIFDEFMSHECRALYNFSQAFPCEISFLAHDDAHPRRVVCRVVKTP